MPHVWGKDEKEVMLERCLRSGCSVRQIPGGGSWQRKRGGHWRSSSREPLPPCTGQEVVTSTPPEPATAEAFATLAKVLALAADRETAPSPRDALNNAKPLLSLLERRMGAMAHALRHIQRWLNHETTALVPASLKRDVTAALTDAPPVFTLEEAKALADALRSFLPEERREWTFLYHREECLLVADEEAYCSCGGTEQGRLVDRARDVLKNPILRRG